MDSPLSTPKPKLIFLWTYTNWGGAQVYLFSIMKVARASWDVLVVLPRESKAELLQFLQNLGVRYEFLTHAFDPQPETNLRGKLLRQFQRIRSEIETYLHLRKYRLRDCVLHIEVAPWQSWFLLTLLSLRKAHVFATLHNFRPQASPLRRAIWKIRFRIVSNLPGFRIFSSNLDTLNSLKKWVTPKFWKTIKVTYTCVDPAEILAVQNESFDRHKTRKELHIPADAFVVLTVGQFIDRKGRWTLLEAARQTSKDIIFVWVMPDPVSDEERRRIDSFQLGERFIPILSSSVGDDRIEILKFFRIGDAFALPSFVEGLPIALLEAMAIGVPSISTNVYAIPEAILHGETGILIEPGDAEGLARSIATLKNEPELRDRLSRNGSSYVLTNFDERVAAATCIRAYEESLGILS